MPKAQFLMVTGSSGYVGSYIQGVLARRYPYLTLLGFSRTGKQRKMTVLRKNVYQIKGDCLKPETYIDILKQVKTIVHCVGSSSPFLS